MGDKAAVKADCAIDQFLSFGVVCCENPGQSAEQPCFQVRLLNEFQPTAIGGFGAGMVTSIAVNVTE